MLAAAELGSTGSQAVEATATTSQAVKTRPRLIASQLIHCSGAFRDCAAVNTRLARSRLRMIRRFLLESETDPLESKTAPFEPKTDPLEPETDPRMNRPSALDPLPLRMTTLRVLDPTSSQHHDLRLSPLILEWALFLLEPAPLRFSRRKPFPHTCAIR